MGEETPPLRIAIVGGAPSSCGLAPFSDASWQIWGMAFRKDCLQRFDALFEIHESRPYAPPGYEAGLMSLGCELVTGKNFPDGPNVTRFPLAEALELGPMTSSAAYMIALAILRGADEIGIYGCDMAVDDEEYFYQRPGVEALIGYARGKGIKVTIPEVSPLAKGKTYGVDFAPGKLGIFSESEFMKLAQMHQEKKRQIDAQIERLQAQWRTHDGSAQAYERMAKTARAVGAGQILNSLADTVILK